MIRIYVSLSFLQSRSPKDRASCFLHLGPEFRRDARPGRVTEDDVISPVVLETNRFPNASDYRTCGRIYAVSTEIE